MKFKRSILHKIEISPTPNGGFIVEIGCAKFSYSGHTQLIQDLAEYLENPADIENQYNEAINELHIHINETPDIQVGKFPLDE